MDPASPHLFSPEDILPVKIAQGRYDVYARRWKGSTTVRSFLSTLKDTIRGIRLQKKSIGLGRLALGTAAFALLGLLILGVTMSAYFLFFGGRGSRLSPNSLEWANFGTYVGGVAGPLLSYLALVAVVWTVRLQYDLLQRDRERQISDQHVR